MLFSTWSYKFYTLDFRETMENAKINKILEERNTIDEMNFRKSGIGPLQKTYKYDPTQSNNG